MSPTSYQTAPPRITYKIITQKRILVNPRLCKRLQGEREKRRGNYVPFFSSFSSLGGGKRLILTFSMR